MVDKKGIVGKVVRRCVTSEPMPHVELKVID